MKKINSLIYLFFLLLNNFITQYTSKIDEEINQEIIIKSLLKINDSKIRLPEGNNNVVSIPENNELSAILSPPKTSNNYISIECCLCTKKSNAYVQLFNAYNNSSLGYDNQISNSVKFITIENIKSDIEFKITKAKNGEEIFIKYSGVSLNTKRNASPNAIKIKYDRDTKILSWNQPVQDKSFTYTIFFDRIDTMKPQYYTLCNTTSSSILGSIKKVISTDSREPNLNIEIDAPEVNNLGEFDVVIIAEELSVFKITMISATYDSLGGNNEENPDIIDDNNKTILIIILLIGVVIVVGIVVSVIVFYKHKKKEQNNKDNRQVSMSFPNGFKENKLIESEQNDTENDDCISQIEENNKIIIKPIKEKEKNNIINTKQIGKEANGYSLVKENETNSIIEINNNQKEIMNENNLEINNPPSKNMNKSDNKNQNIIENQSLEKRNMNIEEGKNNNISDKIKKDEIRQHKNNNNNQVSFNNNLNDNIPSKDNIEKINLTNVSKNENKNAEQIKKEQEEMNKNDETTEDDDFSEDLQLEEPPHLELSEDDDWD